jgi:hypothetical protein
LLLTFFGCLLRRRRGSESRSSTSCGMMILSIRLFFQRTCRLGVKQKSAPAGIGSGPAGQGRRRQGPTRSHSTIPPRRKTRWERYPKKGNRCWNLMVVVVRVRTGEQTGRPSSFSAVQSVVEGDRFDREDDQVGKVKVRIASSSCSSRVGGVGGLDFNGQGRPPCTPSIRSPIASSDVPNVATRKLSRGHEFKSLLDTAEKPFQKPRKRDSS